MWPTHLHALLLNRNDLSEISRRNAMEALLRHDWAYRWKKILDIVGLEPAPQLEMREKRLKQLAEQAGNG